MLSRTTAKTTGRVLVRRTLATTARVQSDDTPPSELVRQKARRIAKAERDERMTASSLLTPAKTHQDGFKIPSRIKLSYAQYTSVAPPPDAYAPHTVFVLESRYAVRGQPGMPEALEHVIGICRTEDLPGVIARYNSPRVPLDDIETMDSARWPFVKQKSTKSYSYPSWWPKEIAHEMRKRIDDIYPENPEGEARQRAAVQDANARSDLDPYAMLRPEGKIPFEVQHADGMTYHPSGFRVPTPETDFAKDRVPAPRVVETRSPPKEVNHDAAIEYEQFKKAQYTIMPHLEGDFSATTETQPGKVPTEVAGLRDAAGEELPPQHASGFVPPTPAMPRGTDEAATYTVDKEMSDAEAAGKAEHETELKDLRHAYFDHIQSEPFWRPLLTITVPTRPLASTLARLSRRMARGQPFFSVVEEEGRRSGQSFSNRIRCLRLDRVQELVVQLGQVLAGARGGPIGLKFDSETVSDVEPLPKEKRTIHVGVGAWYERADEIQDAWKTAGEEVKALAPDNEQPFVVYSLSERGEVLDKSVELPKDQTTKEDVSPDVRDAFNRINELKRLLRETEEGSRSELYVLVERGIEPGEGEVRAWGRGAGGGGGGGEALGGVVPPGYHVLHGAQARGFVKKRIEVLSKGKEDALAKVLSAGKVDVTYP